MSRPESAGTAAPVAGSSRIEMVPPVKRMGTTRSPAGRAGAGPPGASGGAAARLPVQELAVLLLLHLVDGGDVGVGRLLDLVERAALVVLRDGVILQELLEAIVGVAAHLAEAVAGLLGELVHHLRHFLAPLLGERR